VDNTNESPVILSLCTGMRGLERGLERAVGPVTVAAYLEIEAFIIYNLVRQMESGLLDPAPVWTNIKTFPARQFYGKIHGIVGGYPCPGESVAGLRELHKYHGWLWPDIRRIVAATRPVFCFFENVAAHLTGTYPVVYRSLRKMGYAVEAGIYSAEEIGATHERERLYILAIMGNPGLLRSERTKQQATGVIESDKKMADTNSMATERKPGNILRTNGKVTTTVRGKSASSGKEMADANNMGFEEQCKQFAVRSKHDSIKCSGDKFPAGQGEYQHEWEAPRTVKPGLGCTVNGYNFRNDLLRMYGNGVVEQTAELAFSDLLNKHIRTSSQRNTP
jgi:DNA (cytosine-5)-methyltransferase 1